MFHHLRAYKILKCWGNNFTFILGLSLELQICVHVLLCLFLIWATLMGHAKTTVIKTSDSKKGFEISLVMKERGLTMSLDFRQYCSYGMY